MVYPFVPSRQSQKLHALATPLPRVLYGRKEEQWMLRCHLPLLPTARATGRKRTGAAADAGMGDDGDAGGLAGDGSGLLLLGGRAGSAATDAASVAEIMAAAERLRARQVGWR
jgi:hypothetical protein